MDETKKYRPVPVPTEADRRRFWQKVDTSSADGCWPFLGNPKREYPQISLKGTEYRVHRVSYVLAHGSVDEDLVVDHLCGNTRCVRSSHLRAASQRENVLRGVSAIAHNAAKTHCPTGHPYDEANTGYTKTPYGTKRRCRACDRDWHRAAYQAAKAAKAVAA